jgi:hypothetical protein
MNSTPPIIYTFVNDTAPAVKFTIARAGASAINLTGCTVNFYIQNPMTTLRTNTAHTLCTITDAPNGIVSYAWVTGDTPVEGIYDANIRITYADSSVETSDVTIEVSGIV